MTRSPIGGSGRAKGFTMIELMVTVAIVGILASIAIPMYFDFVTRSKLIDGTTKLTTFKSRMDAYFADNRTYLNGVSCGVPNPVVQPSDYFTITCGLPAGPAPTPTSYTILATGIATKGTGNFIFRVDQTDLRSSSGPGGLWVGVGCWAIRKDGSCS
jgi:type IV pilus assembly protein PilE